MIETATMLSKGKVTIPSYFRARLGLKSGDRVAFIQGEGGKVYIIKAAIAELHKLKDVLDPELEKAGFANEREAIDFAISVRRGKPCLLTLNQIKERIAPVLEKWGIHEVYLFGSYARGEATEKSDVDIYCEHGKIKGLFDCIAFEDELEEVLGKDVDVVYFGSAMNDSFKANLDKDKIRIF